MLSLSNILKTNAISSGATALLLVFFPGFAASLFEVSLTIPFVAVGIFLLLFAIYVFRASMAAYANRKTVKTIIMLDWLWVVISIIVIVVLFEKISLVGTVIIAAVAGWVALMAFLQNKGLKSGTGSKNFDNAIA